MLTKMLLLKSLVIKIWSQDHDSSYRLKVGQHSLMCWGNHFFARIAKLCKVFHFSETFSYAEVICIVNSLWQSYVFLGHGL